MNKFVDIEYITDIYNSEKKYPINFVRRYCSSIESQLKDLLYDHGAVEINNMANNFHKSDTTIKNICTILFDDVCFKNKLSIDLINDDDDIQFVLILSIHD